MITSLIVARSKNKCIGHGNSIPWVLPADLKYFKEKTLNKPVIMGWNTWKSIGRPLPNRDNIVVTKTHYTSDATVCGSVIDAIHYGTRIAQVNNVDEIFIIGGAQIYNTAMQYVDRLYVTEIDTIVDGDTFFSFEVSRWKLSSTVDGIIDEKNTIPHKFTTYDRYS